MIDAQKAFVAETQNLAASFPQLNAAFSPIMQKFPQATVGGATIIEGDTVTQISVEDLQAEIEKAMTERGQLAESIQKLAFPEMTLPELKLPEFKTEIIVTPLNDILGKLDQILSTLNARSELPNITVESNPAINLGGAYVFDDSLKKSLVEDITSTIANAVKDAVQQGMSKSNYGFGN